MDDYIDWEIEQRRVGAFYLGMTKEELVRKLEEMGVEYRFVCNGTMLKIDSITFWFGQLGDDMLDKNNLTAMYLYDNFRGKFQGKIGIGTIPYEVVGIEYYGEVEPGMSNTFYLPRYPGITFSLNVKSFVDDKTPIEEIHVTNWKSEIEWAALYRKDKWMQENSIKLMAEYRKLGEEYRRGRNE